MIRATIVSSFSSDELRAAVYEKYRHFIPDTFSDYEWKEGYPFLLPLLPDSKELHEVIDIFRLAGENVTLFSRARYTKSELKNIQYFQMLDPSPLEMEGTTAAEYGTKYEDYCPECPFANNRIGNILVDRKFVKKKKYGTLFPDRFVSAETKIIIEANELTGISFGDPVLDYKGREINPLYSVHFDNVLPPLSKETFLEESKYACENCGRRTIYLRSDLQYESEKLNGAKDFNLTTEYLDNYHMQSLVVSRKVKEVFKKAGIHPTRFIPIALL